MRKLAAELLGTFWLLFGGCGSAVIAAALPTVVIGLLGVALAFVLTFSRWLMSSVIFQAVTSIRRSRWACAPAGAFRQRRWCRTGLPRSWALFSQPHSCCSSPAARR